MVTEVGKINGVAFRSAQSVTTPVWSDNDKIKITELKNVTPDFGVKTPQKYTNTGVRELENGLKIYSYKLANGHKVTVIPMENSPAIVKNYVNVGSMNETDDIKGISHFLEHMAFNGTDGTEGYMKLNRGDSFKKVDEMGGWTNASTNYALTDYVNSTPLLNKKDLEQQIRIIASMAENLTLSEAMVEKEKFPVCSEIDMILDNPETIAIDQTVRSLFNIRSSADELVGGSVNHIQTLDRQKVLDYYNKYYTPDNMHLVVTGDVNPDEVMEIVSRNFHSTKIPTGKRFDEKLTPVKENVRKDFITDKASSATIVLGFAGAATANVRDTVISEIVSRYINSTDAGISEEMKKLNAFMYNGCEKISTNPNNPTFNFIETECSEENTEKVLKLIFDKLGNIKAPDEKTLESIKEALIMDYDDMLENSMCLNSLAGKSAFDKNIDYLTNYGKIVNSITVDDINKYISKYLDISRAAITVIHPETTEKAINSNYTSAQTLSFKGSSRKPVNTDKVSETVLDNNYKIGFSESNNNNVPFNITLNYDVPKNINPAAVFVLNRIYDKGPANVSEKDFLKMQEENNITASVSVDNGELTARGYSSADNFELSSDMTMNLLLNPKISDEEVEDAIEKVKDALSRYDNSSFDLYKNYESKNNPHYDSIPAVKEGLETLTTDDVLELHSYIMNNSNGIITMNIPSNRSEIKESAKEMFSELPEVTPYEYNPEKIYTPNSRPVVLTESRNVSQADINQTYKFRTDGSIKSKVTAHLMNSILSSSDSIGLFNSLREQDHLAYRVNSNLDYTGDCGEISLHILTSTDNKDTGNTSYENVERSITGFRRQINKLINSEYNDEDLETAKRKLKADLLDKESVYSRLGTLSRAQYLNEKLDYENRVFEMIDSVTREDIDALSAKVFANKPVYSIVASQDTLDYNRDFLASLS